MNIGDIILTKYDGPAIIIDFILSYNNRAKVYNFKQKKMNIVNTLEIKKIRRKNG